jgi:hypothetical membrane protein
MLWRKFFFGVALEVAFAFALAPLFILVGIVVALVGMYRKRHDARDNVWMWVFLLVSLAGWWLCGYALRPWSHF